MAYPEVPLSFNSFQPKNTTQTHFKIIATDRHADTRTDVDVHTVSHASRFALSRKKNERNSPEEKKKGEEKKHKTWSTYSNQSQCIGIT